MYGHSALYCRRKSVHVLKGEANVSVKFSLAHITFKTLYVPAGRFGVRILKEVRRNQQKLRFNAYQSSFQGTELPGREVQHSPTSVEVKNEWSYTSVPPDAVMACTEIIFLLLPFYCTIALSS